ncbi:sensor histidine kinase [Streptomyces zingiberis]|uniref:histidine kinase n=1 Tax=Streptomyces zingiberis TaxID=2053010 RepID=A0ABX1BX26_9ACTN|nr:nitrate- and nitrite sensing domain-containing protein [Streptomyces zingiberis]NJQ02249.1 sensor histidine kinase [Streptomyces zingiberis]
MPQPGSLRMILLVLAVIPSLALAALWGVSTAQLVTDWRLQDRHAALAERGIALAADLNTAFQDERRLTSAVLTDGSASLTALREQRNRTDAAVRAFRAGTADDTSGFHTELREALHTTRTELRQLGDIRDAVDDRTATAVVGFDSYTEAIDRNLRLVEALGNVDGGDVSVQARPLTDLMWVDEMISREDAVLAHAWGSDHIDNAERSRVAEWIGVQQYLIADRIEAHLPSADIERFQRLTVQDSWRTKIVMEQTLLQGPVADISTLPRDAAQWRLAMDGLKPELRGLIDSRAADFNTAAADSTRSLLLRMLAASFIGLGAVAVVVALSLWLTGALRKRILALRDEAARLETELPEVVARLQRGEDVDVDSEVREVPHGNDELGQLGQALNLARRSAVETAVRETEQHRGFERLLQRIARRTQLLIGLQLKKLDEMERRHEQPDVLEGLFDLDHLAARLRRYEENLVILGGGQPQRRWRKPVPLLDVMRSALGEVQDYRRIQIEVPGSPWVSGRAVGPVTHIVAELMENATAFSKPPNPVEARAGVVGNGLVVEIEDRGLGMDRDEYERLNRMMADPPRVDMLSRAEDARLGLYVVARLATGLGLTVEFRPSVFGGTRVIVMIPAELVADGPGPQEAEAPARAAAPEPAERIAGPAGTAGPGGPGEPSAGEARSELPRRSPGRAAASVPGAATPAGEDGARVNGAAPPRNGTAATTVTVEEDGTAGEGAGGAATPLPRRVRQASLTPELRREPRPASGERDVSGPERAPEPARSGAAVGAFQRQSRTTRTPDTDRPAHQGTPPAEASTPGTGGRTREDRE